MEEPSINQFGHPSRLGSFRVVSTLGTGGMATVFLGERVEHFSQRVAIKILHSLAKVEDGFGGEGQILTSLDHPGIVRLLDRGRLPNGLPYLVMELVEGTPVDAYCQQRNLAVKERINILLQITSAVSYAHRHLVIHADLKPSNILVTTDGNVKLLDFGIATFLQRGSATKPAGLDSGFTPLFASPEQIDGAHVSVMADVFALGKVASLLMGGRMPVTGSLTSSFRDVEPSDLARIAAERSTDPASLLKMLKGDLDSILLKATQADPHDRYQSAEEFGDELQRYLEGRPIEARPISTTHRVLKWTRRNTLLASLAASIVIVVMGSTVGVAWRAVQATTQERNAKMRLRETVQLTGSLEGELYDSVALLKNSAAAKDALTSAAKDALDSVAAGEENDPTLVKELDLQYQRLERLKAQNYRAN